MQVLFARHHVRVFRFVLRLVRDEATAEDLISEVFLDVWRQAGRFEGRAAVSTWLLAIARNVAVDHYRRDRRHEPLEAADAVSGGESPEDLAERRSDIERLGRLLEQLPERERDLVALKYGAGMTNRAIARLTQLTESNVGTILHRTIHGLRDDW